MRSGVETRYIYDVNGNLLAEADANNVITRYYVHGAGLLAAITPADAVFCYHFDGVGNTVAVTDSSEAVVNSYDYSPFGMILAENETFPQPFKFVGKLGVMAESNGFYYMRARYYDPVIGRFISEDPLGFDGGDVNLYVYGGNNPLLVVDPWGLWIPQAAGATIGGVVGAISGVTGAIAQGGDWMDITTAGFVGAVGGAVAGAINPAGAVATAMLNASIGFTTNIAGQVATNLSHGRSHDSNINVLSAAGSAVGSAVGGGMGSITARGLSQAGASDAISTLGGGLIGLGPSSLGGAFGGQSCGN